LGFRPCSSAAEAGAMALPASLFRAGLLNRSGLHSALDFIIAKPFGRLPLPSCPVRTCFCGMPKSSMFAEIPLDNRTVVHLRPLPPSLAFPAA
jgi:hypothetical protein